MSLIDFGAEENFEWDWGIVQRLLYDPSSFGFSTRHLYSVFFISFFFFFHSIICNVSSSAFSSDLQIQFTPADFLGNGNRLAQQSHWHTHNTLSNLRFMPREKYSPVKLTQGKLPIKWNIEQTSTEKWQRRFFIFLSVIKYERDHGADQVDDDEFM